MLKKLEYYLSPEWEKQAQPLLAELEAAGVMVRDLREGEYTGGNAGGILDRKESRRHSLLVTDTPSFVCRGKEQGIACIGVTEPGKGFFAGTDFVLESFDGVDPRVLEEYLTRFHGLPVTIARTGRVVLREMIPEDFEALYRISRQRGMELAREDHQGENSFHPDCLAAYIRQAYRLYGYGLWSAVLEETVSKGPGREEKGENREKPGTEAAVRKGVPERKEGRLIGCCGFVPGGSDEEASPGCRTLTKLLEEADGTGIPRNVPGTERMAEEAAAGALEEALEMEYMVDEAYRRRGLGREMCRAALEYARDRLEVRRVLVRIRPENIPSLRFAEDLGFR